MNHTEKLIADDEGFNGEIYTDTLGNFSIGYGFNIDAGISRGEAEVILSYQVKHIREQLKYSAETSSFFNAMSAPRQDVLISMAFNMGLAGLFEFKKMLAACKEGNFSRAAMEMLNSKWANQVGDRADRLAKIMLDG